MIPHISRGTLIADLIAIIGSIDFEMCEYDRRNLIYEKEDLLISGTGKYPDYSFWRITGRAIPGKDKGESENEEPPVDLRGLLP